MASGLKLNEDSVEKKLQGVANTQDSIQSLSLWILHHKSNHKKIVEIWLKVIKKCKENDKRLTLFNLCNDVIQTCKRKHATIYLDSFKDVLPESLATIKDAATRQSIERILNIWNQREIYSDDFIQELLAALNSKAKTQKTLIDYKPQKAVERIKSLKTSEIDMELKVKQMGMFRVDISKTEAFSQLKDKSNGKEFGIKFETSCVKLDDTVVSLNRVIDERRVLLELLERGKDFYEDQYGDARIVANAYKVFGNKLNNLHKKLDELRKSLPDPLSPVPSPAADAPSPTSTPEDILGMENNGTVDMDLESDHEGHDKIESIQEISSRRGSSQDVQDTNIPEHRKPLVESDLNIAALADASALEKRIANMLPNMPLGLTQNDFNWGNIQENNSPGSTLVYNPTPKATSKVNKRDARSTLDDKDDGSSTPVMDESPTREAPFDMLSRLINKSHHSAGASPTTSFLESLGVMTTPKDNIPANKTDAKEETTQKSWSNWKAKQAAVAEEEYSIGDHYTEGDNYTADGQYQPTELYDGDKPKPQGIPPMLPPPIAPMLPMSAATTISNFPHTITNFVPPEQADIWRPPPAIITSSEPQLNTDNEFIQSREPDPDPILPPPIPPIADMWMANPRGGAPPSNVTPLRPDPWNHVEQFPSPPIPEALVPSYFPPRYNPNPTGIPFGPRPPPLMTTSPRGGLSNLRGSTHLGLRPRIRIPSSSPLRGLPPSTPPIFGVPSAVHLGIAASNASMVRPDMLSPPTPERDDDIAEHVWSEVPSKMGMSTLRDIPLMDNIGMQHKGTPRRSPSRGLQPLMSSPGVEPDIYRYRSHSGSDDSYRDMSAAVPQHGSTLYNLQSESEAKALSYSPASSAYQSNYQSLSVKEKESKSGVYTMPTDSSSVIAEAQLEFIEKLKRKTKSNEETDHATSLEKILSKTKNVLNKLHVTKDTSKAYNTDTSKSAESVGTPTESEPPGFTKNKPEASTPSERKKPKLSSTVAMPLQSSTTEPLPRRYDSPPRRHSNEYDRRNQDRELRRSNGGRDQRYPEPDRGYERYKEAYYDYYYKQVDSYRDEDSSPYTPPKQRYPHDHYDSRRGTHNWRY